MKKITDLILHFIEKLDFKEKSSPHTIVAYATDLQQAYHSLLPGPLVGPAIDDCENYAFTIKVESKPISTIDEKQLVHLTREYLLSISHLESSTRARKVATFRKFFNYLKHQGAVEKIPSLLTTPKVTQKIPHFISVDEALAILHLFRKQKLSEKELKSQTLFLLLYGTGLRVSEACHLCWNSINISKRELRILGKGNKIRVIAMPTLVQCNLAALRQNQTKEYVWGDKPLNTRTAYNYISWLGRCAELDKSIHPHALRHSYATHLMNDGADLRIIQELLGHASLAATEKYTHVSMDQLARTMESFHPLAKKAQ
ncbi:MAG: tyrosine-type recombinase/integrase [Bdellovibrionaceae bacterium]|nr:tyrosine-type recombinase/integrase [Pseudobdellovibrionaceae bacterium]